MTLRDHYKDGMGEIHSGALGRKLKGKVEDWSTTISGRKANPEVDFDADSWTRQYIDTKFLPNIMDAIDNDGSGYVTVNEVNRFTQSIPSSLKWRYVACHRILPQHNA